MGELKKAFSVKGYSQLDLIEVKSSERGFAYQAGEGFQLSLFHLVQLARKSEAKTRSVAMFLVAPRVGSENSGEVY